MRVSGFIIGILGFVGLILMTGVCALVMYSSTRSGVVDLWASGVQVESPQEVAQALLNPDEFDGAVAATTATSAPLVIPSITPINTVAVAATPAADSTVAPTTTLAAPTEAEPTTSQFASERWSDPREINLLLLGIDERVGFDRERAYHTDTMIVVNIDPVRRTAGVLSFPRDLWVEIPNYEPDRLNQANYIGDINAYPDGGGPGLLGEALNANFGVRIDYFVMVNFTVFETVIDTIAPDGIEICVREAIYDPDYPDAGYGTIEVRFDAGCQRLNGERLLQYARTRATANVDFDRSRRQQEVLEATRQYVLSAGGAQNFVRQIGTLWTELSGSFRTDLTLQEATGLALLANDIADINYNQIGIGYIDPVTLADGRQVLLPLQTAIQELIQQTFYPGATLSLADYRGLAAQENATISVFNNTTIAGLAGNTREYLLGQQITVDEVGNMPTPGGENTVIRYYGNARNTALYIANVLGLSSTRVERGADGLVAQGVLVVAGPDMEAIISGNR